MQRACKATSRGASGAVALALFCGSGLGLGAAGHVRAEAPNAQYKPQPSLAALLLQQRASVDPGVAELRALLRELRSRPSASVAGAVLEDAERTVDQVEALTRGHAELAVLTRRKQIAWAALSLADRLIARALAEHALSQAAARLALAEAAAQSAKAAREAAEHKSAPSRGVTK
ncbi:MAG TPA: hypothetical protein VF331_02120 [Polyangiales bacterium]